MKSVENSFDLGYQLFIAYTT